MKKIRTAVIGCGNISVMHAVSILKQPNVELVSVCDIKPDRAEKAAKKYGCKYYLDYKEMIDKEALDAIHICTPHYLHPVMAEYALTHDLDVLCEKPLAIQLEDALRLESLAKTVNHRLMVSFQSRFNPGSLLIKEAIASNSLGAIISGRVMVTWKRDDEYYSKSDWKGTWDKEGGGVVIDQAIHSLDLLNWFVDSPLKKVEASLHNRCHNIIQVDDSAEGLIQYQNGVNACFFAINYYGYDAPIEIEILCEKGIAKLVGERASIKYNDGRECIADRNPNELFEFGNVKQYWGVGHMKEITHFYEVISNNGEIKNSCSEVMITQKLVCAIYESGKTNKPIYF